LNFNSFLLIDACLNYLPVFENLAIVSEQNQGGTSWLISPQEKGGARKGNHPSQTSFPYPENSFFL
jgi:hypothetical protein